MIFLINALLFLNLLLAASFGTTSAQPSFWFSGCNSTSNYTANSPFAANLNTFLSTLASGNHLPSRGDYLFNLTVGIEAGYDLVSGAAICRTDVAPSDCQSCLTEAAEEIRQICPNQKEAMGFYSNCMIRYSNRPIWGKTTEFTPLFYSFNPANASDPLVFDQRLKLLLRRLRDQVMASGGDNRWAYGSLKVSGPESVYGFMQCTPGMNGLDCSTCLEDVINYIPKCCHARTGASVVASNCGSRFDTYQFYGHITTDGLHGKKSWRRVSIVIIVATVIAISLAIGIWICYRRRKALQTINKEMEDISALESLQFEFMTIKTATHDFSLDNKLGEGGFGEVYKGKLGSGQAIAVKRLSKNSRQGITEFKSELVLVAKLQHKNLVRLIGFCWTLNEKILVYELIPNTSLDKILFDPTKKMLLDWDTRLKIIHGIARGLLYLHEDSRLKVVHRDLKLSNILLDDAMNPKISDFGLAKFFESDETKGKTKRIVGTHGYMAPEYVMNGHFSLQSDVFSFGVMVLEVISGQRNGYFTRSQAKEALLHRAWRLWNEENMLNLVDPDLENKYRVEEVTKCIYIGLLSIQEDPIQRPRMTSIVAVLNGDSMNLTMPKYPQYFGYMQEYTNSSSSDSRNSYALGNRVNPREATNSYSGKEDITNVYPR